MIAHIDRWIEKDGHAGKIAGLLATALFSLIGAGVIPAEHVGAATAAASMLLTFAPAAMRRDVLAKRKALPEMPESMTETTEAPSESA